MRDGDFFQSLAKSNRGLPELILNIAYSESFQFQFLACCEIKEIGVFA